MWVLTNRPKTMEIQIPSSSTVTLGQYAAMTSPMSDAERVSKMFDIELDIVNSWKQSAIRTIIDEVAASIEDCQPKFARFFTADEIEFGFIPNLEGITGAEYADLMNALGQPVINPLDVAAVLFRPVTERINKWYSLEPYEYLNRSKYSVQLSKMPLSTYFGATLFFSTIRNNLRETTLDYLKNLKEELTMTQIDFKAS